METSDKQQRTNLRTYLLIRTVMLAVDGSALVVFLMKTSPKQASLAITLVPLVLVWIAIFFVSVITGTVIRRKHTGYMTTLAAVFATVCMLLMMFSALGSVSVFDFSLLVLLAMLGVFYFRRSWRK